MFWKQLLIRKELSPGTQHKGQGGQVHLGWGNDPLQWSHTQIAQYYGSFYFFNCSTWDTKSPYLFNDSFLSLFLRQGHTK